MTDRPTAQDVADGYELLFDPLTRAAHGTILDFARLTEPDGWPTPVIVSDFARAYRLPAGPLAAFFGLLSYRQGGRTIWVDAVRGPTYTGIARQRMSREQAVAFGVGGCMAQCL